MHIQIIDPVGGAAARPESGVVQHSEAWSDLLAQVSGDIAGPLTQALERVQLLSETGRIDRQSLRRLRDELAQARQVAMTGQRLARYASGRVRSSPERVDLTQMLRELLQQRSSEWRSRGLLLRPLLEATQVQADPSLVFGLLNTLLDWVVPLTRSAVDVRLSKRGWPGRVELSCRFSHHVADEVADAPPVDHDPALDTLSWRLLQQLAAVMSLTLNRHDDASECRLSMEFAGPDVMEGVTAVELGIGTGGTERPLAGSAVLVVADADLCQLIQNAISHMGLVVDFRRDMDEAREFCRRGLPRAIVCQDRLALQGLAQLREEIGIGPLELAVIEIEAEGDGFEVADASGSGITRVGRDALLSGLPAALAFELARSA